MKNLILIIALISLFLPVQKIFSQERELSKEEIVRIAMAAFEKLEGKLQERVIIYDLENGKWRRKFETIDEEIAGKFEVLEDRDYQAVCFAIKPKPGLKGKNVWVFVDRFTGIILALYGE